MSDNPWWLDNALADVSKLKRFPDEGPLLPGDPKSPIKEALLGSAMGVLPWLNDPDKPGTRMQLWPERMARSALTLPGDVISGRVPLYDPETGHVYPEVIDRVQDMSGLIMSGTAFGAPRGSLGTGPARPPAAAEPRAPTFFTGLERELLSTKRGENAAPDSGTMADWQEYLGKRVKPDEVKWLLRPDAVVDPKQRFTKDEIAQRVAENKPQEHWKQTLDEDEVTDMQLDKADTVRSQWESNPPSFTAEPIAAGFSNIVDQHGNIVARHVENRRTKEMLSEFNDVVDEYKKSKEPLTPEQSALQATRRSNAVEFYDELINEVAHNHQPESNAVYGPEDYPEYTLPGGENYREVVVTQPEPAHDPQIIKDYTQLDNDIVAIKRELSNVGNQWQTARDKVRRLRDEVLSMREGERGTRMEHAAELQKAERDVNRAQSRRDQIAEQIPKLEKEQAEMEPAYQRSVEARNNQYTSSHWEEKNALAHARMTDRYIGGQPPTETELKSLKDYDQAKANYEQAWEDHIAQTAPVARAHPDWSIRQIEEHLGLTEPKLPSKPKISGGGGLKSLNIEEVQSDWHQAGQKNKYAGDPGLIDWKQVRSALDLQAEIGDTLNKLVHTQQPNISQASAESLATNLLQHWDQRGVPDSFFTPEENTLAKQWHQAGEEYRRLKHRFNSQDAVPDAPFKATWPDMMLRRLLRKAIDEGYDAISWVPGAEHARRYQQEIAHPEVIGWYPEDGTVSVKKSNQEIDIARDVKTLDELRKVLGKDLADELIVQPGDKIKKLVTLNRNDIPPLYTQRGRRMQSFYDKQLVDKMNAIVGKYGAKVEKSEISGKSQYTVDGPNAQGRWIIRDAEGGAIQSFPTLELANKELGKHGTSVFVVKLNDKMRRDVQSKGFPLFSGGLIPVDGNPFDYDWNKSKAGDLTNRTMMRGDWQPKMPPQTPPQMPGVMPLDQVRRMPLRDIYEKLGAGAMTLKDAMELIAKRGHR